MDARLQTDQTTSTWDRADQGPWWLDLLLVIVLLAGASLRLVGVNWDQNKHLHPDERFLTMVETSISPVSSLAEYFDTAHSSLNPNNVGYSFFVYGTLPVFVVRYVAQWTGLTGYDQVNLVGRQLSAIVDLFTVLMVFLIGSRLYNRRVGLLAAAFSAFAVLQIQLSHYFTVDTFTNLFTFLGIYFAVRVMDHWDEARAAVVEEGEIDYIARFRQLMPSLSLFILFGLALGMAMASKISAAPLAAVLPAALFIRLSRAPRTRWRDLVLPALAYLAVAAIVSLITFRIFQPYAFTGPSFFSFHINQKWIAALKELQGQSTGAVDAPFALQWTNRPDWFGWYNLTAWGLGWPLGLLAWAGFLWMGWRILKGEWREHGLIWAWTAVYFAWQSISFTKTMRYFILIYPSLAIIAAWAIFRLWDEGVIHRQVRLWKARLSGKWVKRIALGIGALVLLLTAGWAFAFSRIYTQPLTRVAASYWIFQNIPGPIELQIDTGSSQFNQQIPYHPTALISGNQPYEIAFQAQQSGTLTDINVPHVVVQTYVLGQQTLTAEVSDSPGFSQVLSSSSQTENFTIQNDQNNPGAVLTLDQVVPLQSGKTYYLRLATNQPGTVLELSGIPNLVLQTEGGVTKQPLPQLIQTIQPQAGNNLSFSPQVDGTLQKILLPHILDLSGSQGPKSLTLSLAPQGNESQTVKATITSEFLAGSENIQRLGQEYTFTFDHPIQLVKGTTYSLTLSLSQGQASLAIYGSQVTKESDWDDNVPQPLDGYPSPDDVYQQGQLNQQVYWSDDPGEYNNPVDSKLPRMLGILDQADTIVISSSRQWASITRVPQRYPLTTEYYRALIGCPPSQDVEGCYNVAQPGTYHGELGFDLVKVFESDPHIDGLKINDQASEEAFTVYDHPKVFIFRKRADYNQAQVAQLLGSVDLSNVIHIIPNGTIIRGNPTAKTLMLPMQQWIQDQLGGTWSQLFNRDFLVNRFPFVGLVVWYLVVFGLGLLVYPILRLALPGLHDRGYPFARLAGLLFMAFLAWIAGSARIPVTRGLLAGLLFLIALAGLLAAYLQRNQLRQEWREKRSYFIAIEVIALVVFSIDLFIRLGNPDLWHPAFGGEKPMDFSYFNAVLKSTTFPPYDPWFAGGYINYYYYGFVLAGMLVKLIGIMPSVAYNLILPTWFMLLGLGAFSLGWNLMGGRGTTRVPTGEESPPHKTFWEKFTEPFGWRAFQIGLAALIGFLILGNLGTVRMIWYGIQALVVPYDQVVGASFVQHWTWTFQGIPKLLAGQRMPYYPGDWYWKPSRAIIPEAGNEITEFPFFTILYADPHAHLFALPITLLVLGWSLSVVLSCGRWGEKNGQFRWLSLGLSFFAGGLAVGALYPTNTWDYYTYLAFGCVALIYTLGRYFHPKPRGWLEQLELPPWALRGGLILLGVIVLAGLSHFLYQPFYTWFGQAYNSLEVWKGDHTPIFSYLTHWGVFLFVILSWMFWETRDWMASTPLDSLRKIRPYLWLIEAAAALLIFLSAVLVIIGVQIGWLVLPMAAWALVLLFRPGQPDTKRFVLFMIGTALMLTLMVELVRVKGDINRMNTVFKFYLQAWTLFSISAAAAFGWLISSVRNWNLHIERAWQVAFALLVFGAALFPVIGGRAKIIDRMAPNAPHTLDGMTFMAYSTYTDSPDNTPGVVMNLKQDYDAIIWMQNNVQGSPVIVEASIGKLYHWWSRFSIYTGLPGVLGWDWHEIQQRAILPDTIVKNRETEISNFYSTIDIQAATQFLQKYNVKYIIVGQEEKIFYPPAGIAKFTSEDGVLWKSVYHQADTTIYEVIGTSPVAQGVK